MNLSAAWEETAALARREGRLVFPIAFLLLALPAALLQAAAPVAGPGAAPQAVLWLLAVPALIAASLIGGLAISHLALGPGAGLRAALRVAAGRFVSLLGAAALVALGGALLAVPVFLVGAAAPALAVLAALAALPVLLFLWVRLLLLTPAAAAEALGPLALIRRSWRLTRGHFWRLLGFVLTAIAVSLVVLMAAGAVGGILVTLVLGRPEPGSAALLLILLGSALLQAVISGLFAAFVARIYVQLAEAR